MTRRSVSRGPGVVVRPPNSYTPPPSPPKALSSFYGVNGHITWNWSPNATPYTQPYWGAAVAAMKDQNIGVYRNGYGVSYAPGTINISVTDGPTFQSFINNYGAPNGIQTVPVLLPNTQAVPTGVPVSEASAYNVGYGLGVDAATYLTGLVPWIEVGNEMDSTAIIDGSHSGRVPSDYVTSTYQRMRGAILGMIDGIKSVDPNMKIMMPGGTWLHTGFFDMLFAGTDPSGGTGARIPVFDYTSWHWYTNNFAGNDNIENAQSYNVLAHLAGWGLPIYITEYGANWDSYGSSESAVTAAITSSSLLMDKFIAVRNTYNIVGIQYYQLFDAAAAGVSPTNREMNFGMIANDGVTQKTRYGAMKTLEQANPIP